MMGNGDTRSSPASGEDRPSTRAHECYPEKDFKASHAFRIGLHLFKTTDFRCRRRVMIAAPGDSLNDYLEPSRVTASLALKQILENDDDDDDILFPGIKRYKKFMKERVTMRKDLDGIDNTKKWLISKDRNPLEDQYLDRLRTLREEQKKKEPSVKSWSMKRPVKFFQQHRDSWIIQAVEEFEEFKRYCVQNGINVNFELAKRALLPPPDGDRVCSELKGPRCPFTIFSEMVSEEKRKTFSGQEEVKKPKRKPKRPKPVKVALSTGACEVGALVDTWLKFKQFKRISRAHYRSRTFPEKFWPGEGLHSRRIPEMEPKRANTENAIFYPVDLIGRRNKYQVVSWQDNKSGYVQLGQTSRKCYHL